MTRSSFQRGWVEKRKRKNGVVWLLRYRVRDASRKGGWRTPCETLKNCPSKKAARKVLVRRMGEINALNNGPGLSTGITLGEFVAGVWMQYLENKGIKSSTQYAYKSMLGRHVLQEFGEIQIGQITPMHVTRFFEKLRKRGLAPHYQLNIYALLRTLFELAVEYEVFAASPVRNKLHRPSYRPKEKPSLVAEQIRQLLVEIPALWKPLFLCLALTGLRIGELLALRWQDIDWDSRKMTVTHALWRGQLESPKTEASIRALHLPETLHQALLIHRERSVFTGPQDFVFCRADGAPLDPGHLRENMLYPAMDRAGIKRSPRTHGFHLFRHSAGSIVHSETGSVKLAQRQLGHAKISTTADIYVHINQQDQERAAEALAQAIDPYCSLIAHQEASGRDQVH